MVKRYYIQDYPEYSGCVLTGLRIASKIMPRIFNQQRSLKALSRQKEPRRKGRHSTNAKLKTNSILGIRNKRLEI